MVPQAITRPGAGLRLGPPSKSRTLLVLGRVSNLPTVWSNCLAGWWLAGGGHWPKLVLVCLSTSLLYVGGMFLNDAFDAGFDRNHRPTRPIPSGAISEREVWQWGALWMLAGLAALSWLGATAGLLGFALVVCVLLYNVVHKFMVIAPLLMGGCRLFVYLLAASVASRGVTGEAVWKAVGLAAYVVGLSYLARKESARVRVQYWPCIFLVAPIALALLIDVDASRSAAWSISTILTVWVLWKLIQTVGKDSPNIGRLISGLLAGIVLVDWLAVASLGRIEIILFGSCFVLALLLQRSIPAT